jgi:hypothetical protein
MPMQKLPFSDIALARAASASAIRLSIVTFALVIAENDALAGQVLTLNAGSHLRASREGLGVSDNSYG